MGLCAVSGSVRSPAGALIVGDVLLIRPRNGVAYADNSGAAVVPKVVRTVVAAGSNISVSLYSGPYTCQSVTEDGVLTWSILVPNLATATFAECLSQADQATYDALTIAMLSVGLRFIPVPTDANTDASFASWSYYISLNGGLLWVYRKLPIGGGIHTAQPIGAVFPSNPAPDGTAGAPGFAFGSDPDTGIYRASANQLGFAAGGAARMLLSSLAMQVNVPITGDAITQSIDDQTAGRLTKIGDFGIGGPAVTLTDWDTGTIGGCIYVGNIATNAPVASGWFLGTYERFTGVYGLQRVTGVTGTAVDRTFERRLNAGVWTDWREVYNAGSILGTVSQSAGVPTGRVIERGTNANGEYVRFADGTQICTRSFAASAGAAVTWTFPAAFAAAPVVNGNAQATVLAAVCLDSAPTTTTVALSVRDKTDARRADTMRLTAIGRWF